MSTDRNTSQGPLNRRQFLSIGAGAGAAMLLAACGGGTSAPPGAGGGGGGGGGQFGEGKDYTGPNVSLAFWNGFTGGDGAFMKKLVDQFNTEHQNIKVTMNVYQWADYYQKVPAAVSTGNGPDLGIMHVDSVATNAARGVVLPLDDLAKSLNLTEGDFSPPVWQAGVYNNQRYSIPLDVHPLGLFYNKAVMEKAGLDPEKPPTTGDEMMTALETCKSKNIQGMWVSPLNIHDPVYSASPIYQWGGKMVNDDGLTVGFAEDPGVKTLTWFKNIIEQGFSPKNSSAYSDFVAFSNDKTAFFFGGPWNTTPLAAIKKLKWAAAPFPLIGDTKAAWAGSHQFVLPRQIKPDENKAIASRVFINWISQQSIGWADAGMVPARNSVRESEEFKKLGAVTEFAKQVDYIHFVPPVPGVDDVTPEFTTACSNAMLGKQPIAQALGEAAVRANKILAANAKKYG